MVNPLQALLSIVIYQVVQFIENQFIYPHVVGGSVGLAPLWTLIAVLIGGNLFGIVGMIFFIPLAAVCYQLLKEYTNRKLRDKNTIVPETAPAAEDGAHQATEE
jgi:predicted PurR-regulated permease PerM